MKSINITKEGILQYYGNRVGYVKNGTAVVDVMFKKPDINDFLTKENGFNVEWQKDIYDRLIKGDIGNIEQMALKNCRLYQLKASTDIETRYIGYKLLKERGFKEPNIEDYKIVYDGSISTNNLEGIYAIFDASDKPEGFTETGIFISDVIELYDENSREFYYINPKGFEKLEHFTEPRIELESKATDKQENKPESRVNRTFEVINTEETPSYKTDEPKYVEESENTDNISVKKEEFQVETFKITM